MFVTSDVFPLAPCLKKTSGPRREVVRGDCRKLNNEKLNDL
jgi:hypothetical protein